MYSEEILKTLLLNPHIRTFHLELYVYKMGKTDAPRRSFWIPREDLLKKAGFLDKTRPEIFSLGIDSLVKNKSGKIMHIPQADFKCKISKENLEHLVKSLKKLGQKGFIVQTQRSYHFYGQKLLNDKNWIIFMGKLLRLNDYRGRHLRKVSDQRWIGANLMRGQGTLRISSSKTKKGIPKIVHVIE